jgi:oxygen-independent coproporphyrinogen-3 oxidase
MQAFRHLYVHVPFCRHKCGYCDFNAYAGMDRLMPDYVDALERELIFARERYPFQQLETVYLGGGTPSLLPAELATRLLDFIRANFNVAPDAEVTLEANPASTDEAKVGAWLAGGVNRLSLGVQGFDKRALAVLERKTDAAQATHAYALARDMGMANISVDLIYAVPYQSLATWLDTLRRAIDLGARSRFTTTASFEGGTLLRRRQEASCPSRDRPAVGPGAACAELETARYHRYEVSNWARGGGISNHATTRRTAWRSGLWGRRSAHSYATDGTLAWRWWNVARRAEYITAAPAPGPDEEGTGARPVAESLMLGLRTAEGMAAPRVRRRAVCLQKEAGLGAASTAGSCRPAASPPQPDRTRCPVRATSNRWCGVGKPRHVATDAQELSPAMAVLAAVIVLLVLVDVVIATRLVATSRRTCGGAPHQAATAIPPPAKLLRVPGRACRGGGTALTQDREERPGQGGKCTAPLPQAGSGERRRWIRQLRTASRRPPTLCCNLIWHSLRRVLKWRRNRRSCGRSCEFRRITVPVGSQALHSHHRQPRRPRSAASWPTL